MDTVALPPPDVRINVIATATLDDGRVVVVTGHDDASVRLWNADTRRLIRSLDGHAERVMQAACARLPDGRMVAVTGDVTGGLRVWDLSTGSCIGHLRQGSDGVTGLALVTTRDERLIAVTGSPSRLKRWDVGAGSTIRTLTRTGQMVDCVATAALPDGRLVAVTGCRTLPGTLHRTLYRTAPQARCTLRLWDVNSGAALGAPMEGHAYAVNTVATAALPDGRTVAVSGSSDGTVRVWDLVIRQQIDMIVVARHLNLICDLSLVEIGPGRHVAVIASSSGAYLWELGTPAARPIDVPSRLHWCVATGFRPDGRLLAIFGSGAGGPYVQPLDSWL